MLKPLQRLLRPAPEPGGADSGNRHVRYLLFAGFFFIFFFVFTISDYSSIDNDSGLYHEIAKMKNGKIHLTPENVREEISKCGMLCPELVFAQIMLESGNLGSYLTNKTNNLVGMRFPFRRTTKAIGLYLPEKEMIVLGDQKSLLKYSDENNYAVYSNWQECLSDYKYWQEECFKLSDRYLRFLGEYYAEDEQYVDKLKSMSQK